MSGDRLAHIEARARLQSLKFAEKYSFKLPISDVFALVEIAKAARELVKNARKEKMVRREDIDATESALARLGSGAAEGQA